MTDLEKNFLTKSSQTKHSERVESACKALSYGNNQFLDIIQNAYSLSEKSQAKVA